LAKKTDEVQPIIIKKIKKAGHGHHGGAWKVAYADFVTAMMAFFMLLWLLNVTTEEQKNAISNYFDPSAPQVSESTSGAGGVMGGLSVQSEGAMTDTQQEMTKQETTGKASNDSTATEVNQTTAEAQDTRDMEQELKAREDARFEHTKEDIEKALQETEEMRELAKHLMIDITPEGLRIQIIDQDKDPMFASGSAQMFEKTQKLIAKVADLIKPLPNAISVRGHTDATPYANASGTYTNWELSADRANATRRILESHAIPQKRLANVMGKSDTELFLPQAPNDARNRRISLLMLRESLEDAVKRGEFNQKNNLKAPIKSLVPPRPVEPAPNSTYQKTQGAVQFP
jgi:chemotaxis protein MotB